MENNEKAFFIPKNVNPEFEIVGHLTIKDLVFFIPSLVIDIPLLFTPIPTVAKIVASTITLFIPFSLVYIRPHRENIQAWKVLMWEFQFRKRQKKYTYRKRVDEFVSNKK